MASLVQHFGDEYLKHGMFQEQGNFKGAQYYFFNFFQTFGDFDITRKLSVIFVITCAKFYSWNMFRLEEINENMTGYGNNS